MDPGNTLRETSVYLVEVSCHVTGPSTTRPKDSYESNESWTLDTWSLSCDEREVLIGEMSKSRYSLTFSCKKCD